MGVLGKVRASDMMRWIKKWFRLLFALLGIGVVAFLIKTAGPEKLWKDFIQLAAWLPVALGFEILRLLCDMECTYQALGEERKKVSRKLMLRSELISTAVGNIVPAGRSTQEASKAALLSPHVGASRASAAGVISQVATFLAGGLITVPGTLAAWKLTGSMTSFLTVALFAHSLILVALGIGLESLTRSKKVFGWVQRHFKKLAEKLESFHEISKKGGWIPWRPFSILLFSRLLQTVQIGLLIYAVGVPLSVSVVFLAEGLMMLALILGAVVPGEMGVSEGTFILYAGVLGARSTQALSVALLLHIAKLALILVGALTPLLWKVE